MSGCGSLRNRPALRSRVEVSGLGVLFGWESEASVIVCMLYGWMVGYA